MGIFVFVYYVLRIIIYFSWFDFVKRWFELEEEFVEWYGYC